MSSSAQVQFTDDQKKLGQELKGIAKILEVSLEDQTKFINSLSNKSSTEIDKMLKDELVSRLGDCGSQSVSDLIRCSESYRKQEEDLKLQLNEFLTRMSSAEKETFMSQLKQRTQMKSRIEFLKARLTEFIAHIPRKGFKGLWIALGVGAVFLLIVGAGTFWYIRKRKTVL